MKRPAQIFNFRIQNSSSSDSVDIYIDGEIVDAGTQEIYRLWFGDETSVSFKSFRDQLEKSGANTYNIFINSPGGQVSDAMAMHDYLQDKKAKGKRVNTFGRGIIASAATYILMAGDEPEMSSNSWFMIHNVSGWVGGDINEMEKQVNVYRKFNDAVRDFYANSTGIGKDEVSNMMDAETWMQAEEAKSKGFIRRVSNEVSFTNMLSAEYWDYANKEVLNAYNSAVKSPLTVGVPDNIQQFIINQNNDMKKFFSNIFDGLKNIRTDDNTKPADIVNQITEALKPLETVDSEIEQMVNTAVTAALNTAKNELQTASNEAITALQNKVNELEKKNQDLEKEVADDKGNPTNTGNGGQGDGVKPVGGYRKG